jgi:nucleoside-diphosphate-sugar epimerase
VHRDPRLQVKRELPGKHPDQRVAALRYGYLADTYAGARRVVARRTGVEARVAAFPWWLLTLASPFITTFREMREMRYLWRNPLRMDNTRLVSVLGREPHTPLDEAVEATLGGLECLLQDLTPSLQR